MRAALFYGPPSIYNLQITGFDSGVNPTLFNAGGALRMTLTPAGYLGIGTNNPSAKLSLGGGSGVGSLGVKMLNYDGGANGIQSGFGTDMSGKFYELTLFSGNVDGTHGRLSYGRMNTTTGAYTQHFVIDENGNSGVGVEPSVWGASVKALQIKTGAAVIADSSNLYLASNGYFDGSNWVRQTANQMMRLAMENGQFIFTTWASGAAGSTSPYSSTFDVLRVDNSGNLLVGVSSNTYHSINKSNSGENAAILEVKGTGTAGGYPLFVSSVGNSGYNAGAAAIKVGMNTTTSRSINAAGTVNASGADYAEYMTKSSDCGTLAKGQIVGVDAQGLLTDKFDNAVSFLIKSSDPSYVGGDTWGSEAALGIVRPVEPVFVAPERGEDESDEDYSARIDAAKDNHTGQMALYESNLAEFENALEIARQKVDRIAYCGQVPVNVTGAKPGQYVVPTKTGTNEIGAVLIAPQDMSLPAYMFAVGIVQNILPDGRANVRVKVA